MMQKNSTRHLLLALALATSSLTACGDEEEELSLTAAPEKKVVAPKVEKAWDESAKKEDLVEEYAYEAVNRRDPFKTYFDELIVVEDRNTENLTELQRFELDKMKLVGVVVGTATPMAMVEDPSGKGHTIKINTLIGKRYGQVKHIRRGEIVVREEFRDFTGKRIPVFKPMRLEAPTRKR
ncbi:MAG: pilus assembly protein PilP [Deltaproteobacteria bacterium]|nr:pilus assembly protein PilP [Deltaproteobacteria bacterium]